MQLRQHDHAFLFVGVGARDDGDGGLGLAPVVGQVRRVGRDVDEVAGARDDVVLEALAVPGARFAAQHVDRRLVRDVLVGRRPRAGGMVRNCMWMAFAPTVSAEIAGA